MERSEIHITKNYESEMKFEQKNVISIFKIAKLF